MGSLIATNETLEEKGEELRRQVDDLNQKIEIERRKSERLLQEQRLKKDEAISKAAAAAAAVALQSPTSPISPTSHDNGNRNTHQLMVSSFRRNDSNISMDFN